MKALHWSALLSCALVAQTAFGLTLFTDNFESGVSGSKWVNTGVTNSFVLVGDNAHAFGTQAAKQVNADPWVYYMKTADNYWSNGIVTANTRVVASVMFWDDVAVGGTQVGGLLLGSSQNNGTGLLNDFYQLLVNSTVAAGGNGQRYVIRSSLDGYADSGVTRTQGWHEFRIEANPYVSQTNGDVKMFIDGQLVGTRNRRASGGQGFVIDDVRLGASVKTPGSPFWYDNVSVARLPEPATALLLIGGLLPLIRRRHA